MLEDIKKPQGPTPPAASARTFSENVTPHKIEASVFTLEQQNDFTKLFDKGWYCFVFFLLVFVFVYGK